MSSNRYTEEFKFEAMKQITDRGHSVREVTARLGVSVHSLYTWRKQLGMPAPTQAAAWSRRKSCAGSSRSFVG